MIYDTEDEAKEYIDKQTKLMLSKFCPLIVAQCRPDCFCYMSGEIQMHGEKFRVPFVGCGNGMFDYEK